MINEQTTFEFDARKVIKGFPELHWTGKRPYTSTQYFPAQLKERYGEEQNGWINKIYWGDNLQVMSHLLKEYRGKVDLIYIDPPFDSKADYKMKIEVRGVGKAESDSTSFEEKQYGDIWTSDRYLQFMYERLILCRELLSPTGSIYLHCDWHKSHYLRMLLDSVFGPGEFRNEIVWCYEDIGSRTVDYFKRKHDTIFLYARQNNTFNVMKKPLAESTIKRYKPYFDKNGQITYRRLKETNPGVFAKLKGIPENLDDIWLDVNSGGQLSDWWIDISPLKKGFAEAKDYPTQKPEALLERIIKSSSNSGDLVFDCFMGSGTTQAVAMKLGRRFIGADINLGAIQTTTKRLLSVGKELQESISDETKYTSFEVYNVNNYDFFRNPVEARDLIINGLEIQSIGGASIWDGELDGRMVKILPVNRIATKADLEGLKATLPYQVYDKRKEESPREPVERITLICMGHESDLKAAFEKEIPNYKFDIQVMDLLQDKKDIILKREAEADIIRENGKLVIKAFYPLNLMQKLLMDKDVIQVDGWRPLVDSIMIDWNYDGAAIEPSTIDVPEDGELVSGEYEIPKTAGVIRVKITDVLSESIEVEV